MTKNTASTENKIHVEQDRGVPGLSRRKFLNYAGAASGIALLGAACKKDNDNMDGGVDLGSGDVGILNYAYALEQLEAAFYIQVIATPYANINNDEKALLTDIRDHEIAHREFFKAALGGAAIPALQVDFSSVDFTNRESVLGTAKAFEDLGVSAYNGAGPLITSKDNLTLTGKIVSVEARHAALIRDLITPGSFVGSDVVDAQGMEIAKSPSMVLGVAGKYIKTKINASNLPS